MRNCRGETKRTEKNEKTDGEIVELGLNRGKYAICIIGLRAKWTPCPDCEVPVIGPCFSTFTKFSEVAVDTDVWSHEYIFIGQNGISSERAPSSRAGSQRAVWRSGLSPSLESTSWKRRGRRASSLQGTCMKCHNPCPKQDQIHHQDTTTQHNRR